MKRYFNLDLHISVIADIKNILNNLLNTNENINIIIEDWSLSGHNWVFNKQSTNVEIINSNNWNNINTELIFKFQEKYDNYLKTFDGFICCHPNVFVLLFEKYNKPIIVINSCRYDMPFCWNNNYNMIKELHKCFIRLQLNNNLIFISNNKADNKYFKLGNPIIKTCILPSLCLYTNMKWNKIENNNKFLVYSGFLPKNNSTIENIIIYRNQLGKYKWNMLMRFKGIIHLPYEASTMSIFEQISSGIPLFFPSKKFLKYLWINNVIKNQMNYWKHKPHSSIPNYLKETENIDFWIENADYYHLEGYYYFDSFEHLYSMLLNFNDEYYDIRMKFIENRKITTLNSYKELLELLL